VYHVTARGNERRAIVRDDQDRQLFVTTLAEMVERFGVRVHAYCLMPNHYHLVVGTPLGNLSQAVGWLQVTYTVRFNRRHRRSGHLFQGRFKAQLVEADAYAQWLVEYVHLNPVRPRRKGEVIARERAAELDAYSWSSHRDYAGLRPVPAWLCLDWRRYWGATAEAATQGYRQRLASFFEAGQVASPWEKLRGGLVLGGEELWAKAERLVAGKQGQEEGNWTKAVERESLRKRVEELVAVESEERIKMWLLVRVAGERCTVVGRRFKYRDGSGVAYVLRQLEAEIRENPALADKLQQARRQCEVFRADAGGESLVRQDSDAINPPPI
jgi:REP element-mobilizing transposase RayT